MSSLGMPPQDGPDAPLLPGERVIWTGRPDADVWLEASDAALIPFSVLWGGFAIVWEVMVVNSGAPVLLKIWGIPFVAIGVYLLVGRFFVRRWQRRRTTYLLTDRRALIVRGNSVRAEPAGDGPSEMRIHRDGRHITVAYGSRRARARQDRIGERSNRQPAPVVFESVTDVPGLQAAIGAGAGPQDAP